MSYKLDCTGCDLILRLTLTFRQNMSFLLNRRAHRSASPSRLYLCLSVLISFSFTGSDRLAAQNGTPMTLQAPMRDSTMLETKVFTVHPDSSRPCILIRTLADHSAYGEVIRYLLTHEYHVAVQTIRSVAAPQPADTLFLSDGWGKLQDGYDTIEWLAEQEWCNGRIAAFGRGIDGFLIYLLAAAAPPHLQAAYVIGAPFNYYVHAVFQQGAFREKLVTTILEKHHLGDQLALYEQNPLYGPFWFLLNPFRQAKAIDIPITHASGWYDIFKDGAISAFQAFKRFGQKFGRRNQRLLLGPWSQFANSLGREKQGEIKFPENARFDVLEDMRRWFDQWLKAKDTGLLYSAPVEFYVMGAVGDPEAPGNVWREAAGWPPPHDKRRFYLQSDSLLAPEEPKEKLASRSYEYTPSNPVPTLGGANYYLESGPYDQQYIEARKDVLVFSTRPLEAPLTIMGPVQVKLHVSSTKFDTDFTAKLTDVYPDGRSMLIVDGITRARLRDSTVKQNLLKPGKMDDLSISLGNTAYVFQRGHRIRLVISSSNSPRFEPNPNSPRNFHRNIDESPATNTVYFGRKKKSFLELPVVTSQDQQ